MKKFFQSYRYTLLLAISLVGFHALLFRRKVTYFSRNTNTFHSRNECSKKTNFALRSLHVHYSASNIEITQSIEDYVKHFRKAVVKCSPTSHTEKKSLLNELMVWVPHLTPTDLVKIMNGILSLKLISRSKELLEVHSMILDRLDEAKYSITSKEMNQILILVVKLGISCSDMKFKRSIKRASLQCLVDRKSSWTSKQSTGAPRGLYQTRTSTFFDVLPRAMQSMDVSQLSSSLWALGKIGFLWDELSFDMQRTINQGITSTSTSMSPMCVANTIHGLSNLRVHWEAMPSSVRACLIDAMQSSINHMKEQEASNTISGLGRLGVSWNSLHLTLRTSLGDAFADSLPVLGPKGLAMSVHGLGRMAANISSLPSSFRENIMVAICNISSVINAQEVANILYGLGKIGSRFADSSTSTLPADRRYVTQCAKTQLLKALTRVAPKMGAQGISNSLWGLMLMHAQWRNLAYTQRQVILQTLSRELCHMDEQQVGNTVYSLGALGLTWKELKIGEAAKGEGKLEDDLVFALQEKLPHMTPSGVVMTLMGLGNLQAHWKTLPISFRTQLTDALVRVLRSASDRTVSSLLYSLTVCSIHWNDLDDKVQSAIQESIARTYWDATSNLTTPSATNKTVVVSQQDEITSDASAMSLMAMGSASAAAFLLQEYSDRVNTSQIILPISSKSEQQVSVLAAVNNSNYTGRKYTPFSSGNVDLALEKTFGTSGREYHIVYTLGLLQVTWDKLEISAQKSIANSLATRLPGMDEQGVVNSLYGLSSVGVKWFQLDEVTKAALLRAVTRVSESMGEKGVAVTVLSLAKMDLCWKDDLKESEKDSIRRAIARQSNIGEHALSSLLYGLGKLSRKWEDLQPDVRLALKTSIVVCHINNKCTPQGVANSLYGMSQMQTVWANLSSSVRMALFKEVFKSVKSTSETQLSTMIASLGKMGVQWHQIPLNLQNELLMEMESKSSNMNEQHLSNVLFALGSMGLKWETLPRALKVSLMAGLYRVNFDRDDNMKKKGKYVRTPSSHRKWCSRRHLFQETQTVLFSRDGLTLKDEVPTDIFFPYIDSSKATDIKNASHKENEHDRMNAQGLSMSIVGLSKLGATWVTIPEHFVTVLENSLLRLVSKMNLAQLSNTLSAMSKMLWRWENLNESLRKSIISSTSKLISQSGRQNFRDVSMVINSLGTLGLRWASISSSSSTFKSINHGISLVLRKGDREEVAGVVFGMGLMDFSWTSISEKIRRDIIHSVKRVFSGECSSSKANESFMKARYQPVQLKNSVVTMTRSQALANTVYGISLLVFDTDTDALKNELNEVHIALLDEVACIGVGSFTEAEKEQVAIYMNLLQTSAGLDDSMISNRCPNHMLLKADHQKETKTSRLQQSVVSSLRDALRQQNEDLFVANEYSAFNGAFPVDATVFEGETPVAFLEVDGPQHYREGVLLRKDIMKETLYRRKHPCAIFTRVKFDQVNNFGSKYVGKQVADYITLTMHQCDATSLNHS